jgi:hypothetical protein
MTPVEPWPGYADASESDRLARLHFKVDEARLRSDLLYAHAVAAAVANYESLARDGASAAGELEKAAGDHLAEIAKAGSVQKPRSWGHG